jgi:hypothetical protein
MQIRERKVFTVVRNGLLLVLLVVGCGRSRPLVHDGGRVEDAANDTGSDAGPTDVPSDLVDDRVASLDVAATENALRDVPADNIDASVAVDESTEGRSSDGPLFDSQTDGRLVVNRAISVASGSVHTCALLDDHRVKCWGNNGYGQLGLGDNVDRGLAVSEMGDALPYVDLGKGRTAIAIAAGRYASCAILDNKGLKCWGLGSLTGLGTDPPNRGDKPGQMGDALPFVDLGAGHTATRVAIGFYDACVVRENNTVRCWGTSSAAVDVPVDGVIVDLAGASSTVAAFADQTIALLKPGTSASPTRVDVGGKATKVSGSRIGPCAVLSTGGVGCASNIRSDSLPDPRATNISSFELSESGYTAGILTDGSLRAWRTTNAVPSGPAPAADTTGGVVVEIGGHAASLTGGGEDHACVLLVDGEVKCWSWSGQPSAALGGSAIVGSRWSPVDLGSRVSLDPQ